MDFLISPLLLLGAKARRRRELASLPFEKKLEIVLELQRSVAEIRRSTGRPGPEPWEPRTDVKRTLGPDPVVEAYKEGIDRTLLRENLRLTVEERFRHLMRLQALAEELQRAGRAAKTRS